MTENSILDRTRNRMKRRFDLGQGTKRPSQKGEGPGHIPKKRPEEGADKVKSIANIARKVESLYNKYMKNILSKVPDVPKELQEMQEFRAHAQVDSKMLSEAFREIESGRVNTDATLQPKIRNFFVSYFSKTTNISKVVELAEDFVEEVASDLNTKFPGSKSEFFKVHMAGKRLMEAMEKDQQSLPKKASSTRQRLAIVASRIEKLNSLSKRAGRLFSPEEQAMIKQVGDQHRKKQQSQGTQMDPNAGAKAKRVPEAMKMKKALLARLEEAQKLSTAYLVSVHNFLKGGYLKHHPSALHPLTRVIRENNKVLPRAFANADKNIIHKYEGDSSISLLVHAFGKDSNVSEVEFIKRTLVMHAAQAMEYIKDTLQTGESLDGIGDAMSVLKGDLMQLSKHAREGIKFNGDYDKELAAKTLSGISGAGSEDQKGQMGTPSPVK